MRKKGKDGDLGRSLQRRKERDRRESRKKTRTPSAQMASVTGRHTTQFDDGARLQSVLDATDLEELMLNATLANEDFTAERYPAPIAPQTVVVTPFRNQISNQEKIARNELDRTILRIPRRPKWDASTTYAELMEQESRNFLEWRRKIAKVEEENSLASTIGGAMMTPFEKNVEVWRQLWRVVERSDVVVQIVDARNPLLYYCEDMFRYVTKEMGRAHLLLLNKADLLSARMIEKWQAYFDNQGVDVLFFSAFQSSVKEEGRNGIIGAQELIQKLEKYEHRTPKTKEEQPVVVGMCGYPNVGKSSTINVLVEIVNGSQETSDEDKEATGDDFNADIADATDSGAPSSALKDVKVTKRVAVSATPGKTKHFQTLILTPRITLCDCPGLVFPNFSNSKSELITAGVLSIDSMRGDHMTPVSLICSLIPRVTFEAVYGIHIPKPAIDSDKSTKEGYASATELLEGHARARGFMTDHNRADTSRSARVILKDFTRGKLIFAHGPPGNEDVGESGVGPEVFAKKGKLIYEKAELRRKKAELQAEKRFERDGVSGESRELLEGIHMRTGANGNADVRARVGRGKKAKAGEFKRVQRNFYPSEWAQ